MDYRIDDQVIALKKGTFVKDILPGTASKIRVDLSDWLILGDLNNDHQSDAAIILTANMGGSGRFFYLIPVLWQTNNPLALEAILLGDRISMVSLNIENQQINVVYLGYSPEEAMATSPSREIQRHFILRDHVITEVNDTSMNVAAIISSYSP